MGHDVIDTIGTAGWREGNDASTMLELRATSLEQMRDLPEVTPPREQVLAPPPKENPEVLTIGKWAVVTLEKNVKDVKSALAPLIEHRREKGQLWQDGLISFNPSKSGSTESWRRRLEKAAGGKPPHYLMLVGGPDELPFSLQFDLDLSLMTGRLDVSDEPNGPFSWTACRRYAEKVVAYENGGIDLSEKPLFYSVTNDDSTRNSHKYLVLKLAEKVPGGVSPLYEDKATVMNLLAALDAERAPRFVFTASHGVEHPVDPARWGALTEAGYHGRADDAVVSATAAASRSRVGYGSIIFSFACFSAGVPQQSVVSFLTGQTTEVEDLGQRVAPLPRLLLGHAQGPVAFIGHVDRVSAVAFQSSLGMQGVDPYHHFEAWLRTQGGTVGRALGTIRDQTKRIGTEITASLQAMSVDEGQPVAVKEAGRKWVGFHDFEGYMLVGDPAVTPPQTH